METKERQKIAMAVSRNSIVANIILSAFKLVAGIVAHSGAMVSDAVHSISDVVSTVVVMIGVKAGGKEEDSSHPYGHDRLECVAAILLSALLFATGAGIGYSSLLRIFERQQLFIPGRLALVAALASIIVKEAMYWYTRHAAKRIESSALLADAWHHRTDALSSVGSLIGIFGARMGFPVLDPVAGVVICLFILKAAIDIFRDAVGKMTDRAADDGLTQRMSDTILAQEGVLGIDVIKTRVFGDRIYVDVEIQADGDASLHQAHDIAHRTHDAIEEEFPKVKHCMVHVNPDHDHD